MGRGLTAFAHEPRLGNTLEAKEKQNPWGPMGNFYTRGLLIGSP